MKNLFIVILMGILVSSCNLFESKRMFSNDIDTLLAKRLESDSIKHAMELARIRQEAQAKIDSIQRECAQLKEQCTGKYHVIAGSFLNPDYAEKYANKMKELGYEGQIIKIQNGFNLVSAASSNNYNRVLQEKEEIRASISLNAWIYVK